MIRDDLVREDVPQMGGPERYVRRLKANEKINALIISHSLWGCYVHYDRGIKRSSPHLKSKEKCVGCRSRLPIKQRLYLFIYNTMPHAYEFLELSPGLAKDLLRLFPQDETLRGKIVSFTRGAGDKARTKAKIEGYQDKFKNGDPLPPGEDPLISLEELWGVGAGEYGDIDNPASIPFQEAI